MKTHANQQDDLREELRRARARLDEIQALGELGCWEWNVTTDQVSWTEQLFHIHGLPSDKLPPTFAAYLEYVHPDDRARVASIIAAARGHGDSFDFEERIIRPDGDVRTLHIRGTVERGANGREQRLVGVCRDVTALRAAHADSIRIAALEAARRASEANAARQQFLADATAILASSIDHETTLRNVARSAVPSVADWCAVDLLDESDELRRLAVEHSDPSKVALAHELQQKYPPDRNAPHGVWHVVRTREPEILSHIPDELLVAAARDEEHLRLLRGLGLKSFIVAPLSVGNRILGAITVVQAESGRVFTEDDLPLMRDIANRSAVAIDNAQVVHELELTRTMLMEQADELEAQASEMEAQSEELQHTMTELEMRNEELQQRTIEAQAANQAKSHFLATMSHELRTPLNAIAGYTELLEIGIHGPVTAQQKETLGRIQRSQRRLLALINDILNFVKIDAGQITIQLQRVPLATVLTELAAIIEPQIRNKGLILQIAQPPADLAVHADRERTEQVLINLLVNAVKFTPPGGRVEVRAEQTNGMVHIHITDTGRGIPADRLEEIFEPFVQVDPYFTRVSEGIGLGLSISSELARAMGGDIVVESELGRGSTFTLLLPVATADVMVASGEVAPTD